MSDASERPRYGEYATPEQQRARIEQSGGEVPPVAPAVPPMPLPTASGPVPTERPTTTTARRSRTADRVITIALLVYGLFTVLTTVPQLLDFSGFIDTWTEMAGIDEEFTNYEQGMFWARTSAFVFAGGWILTAVLSWLSLSRGRVSWWIPLVGAIVTFIIVSIMMAVPLASDPAIIQHFSGT